MYLAGTAVGTDILEQLTHQPLCHKLQVTLALFLINDKGSLANQTAFFSFIFGVGKRVWYTNQ